MQLIDEAELSQLLLIVGMLVLAKEGPNLCEFLLLGEFKKVEIHVHSVLLILGEQFIELFFFVKRNPYFRCSFPAGT